MICFSTNILKESIFFCYKLYHSARILVVPQKATYVTLKKVTIVDLI